MFGPGSPLLFWHGFLIAFTLTCAVEVPPYLGAFAALGWVRRDGGPLTRRSAIALMLAGACGRRRRGRVDLRRRTAPGQVSGGLGSRLAWCAMIALGVNALSLLVGLLALPLLTSGPTVAVG